MSPWKNHGKNATIVSLIKISSNAVGIIGVLAVAMDNDIRSSKMGVVIAGNVILSSSVLYY